MKQINKEKWSEVFSQSKEKLAKTTKNVVDRLEDGVEELMEHEKVQTVIRKSEDGVAKVWNSEPVQETLEKTKAGVQRIKSDEKVQSGIKKLKRGTLKAADYAYEGLNRLLKDEDDEVEIKGIEHAVDEDNE